ncbi:glycosyltransferase [Azospirillaceae bacterium]
MLLSIITPSLNRRDMIVQAIESVIHQDYPHFEHIIIDGGSTDGTLDMLSRYPHLKLVSEPDLGLYDAINKGISLSQGEVIGHLNSDDAYIHNIFNSVMDIFINDTHIESVCGGIEVVDGIPDGKVILKINHKKNKILREGDVIRGLPLTNARFFRRSVYARIGLYDLRFPIAADRDFLMRALLAGIERQTLPEVIYRYRSHNGSLTYSTESVARDTYLRDYVTLSRTRLEETLPNDPGYAVYKRWHAWIIGYMMFDQIRRRQISAGIQFAADGCVKDALWPIRFAGQVWRHLYERRERHGK